MYRVLQITIKRGIFCFLGAVIMPFRMLGRTLSRWIKSFNLQTDLTIRTSRLCTPHLQITLKSLKKITSAGQSRTLMHSPTLLTISTIGPDISALDPPRKNSSATCRLYSMPLRSCLPRELWKNHSQLRR